MTQNRLRAEFIGPCLEILGGAAFLIVLILALRAAGDQPPSAEAGAAAAPPASWEAAAEGLEARWAEPEIELLWSRAALREDSPAGVLGGDFHPEAFEWARTHPAREADSTYRMDFRGGATRRGFTLLRCRFKLRKAQRLRAFFSGSAFLAVVYRGKPLYAGFFDGTARPDEKSVPLDLPAGPSSVYLVVEVPPGDTALFFRLGRLSPAGRRIKILTELQRLFPGQRERVLAARLRIAETIERGIGDPLEAERAYEKAAEIAAGDLAQLHAAYDGIARCRRARGLFDGELEMRRRMAGLSRNALPDRIESDLVSLSQTAARCGRLDLAHAAAREAVDRRGSGIGSLVNLLELLRDYAMPARVEEALSTAKGAGLDGESVGRLREIESSARSAGGGQASLDLDYTAREAIDSAWRSAEAGAFDQAAAELQRALAGDGTALVPSGEGAVSAALAVASVIEKSDSLRQAWLRLAGESAAGFERSGAALFRPETDAWREGCLSIARDAAFGGRYNLAALGALRCLKAFPREADAAALAVSSLYAAGRIDEARRLRDSLGAAVLERTLAGGGTLSQFISAFDLDTFGAPSPRPCPPFDQIDVLWRAPLAAGDAFRGSLLRLGAPDVAGVKAAVEGERLYVVSGGRLVARDISTGEEIFSRPLPVPPATALVEGAGSRRALAQAPCTGAAGGGALYLTLSAFDGIRSREVTFMAACDRETGNTLWLTPADAIGKEVSFMSPPAWAHDRLYVVTARGSGTKAYSLAALDARDGTLEWETPLCAGYPSLGAPGWRGAGPIPSTLVPAPAVSGDSCFVAMNAGAVAEVDCLTGQVRRVQTYHRSVLSSGDNGLARLLAERSPGTVAAFKGGAAFAPGDCAETLLLPPGGWLERFEIPGAREIIGVEDDTAVCVGDDVYGVDIQSGRLAWRAGLEGAAFLPGGIMRGGIAFVPARECLFVIAADGRVLGRPEWPEGVARGNLAAAGDDIIAFSRDDYALIGFGRAAESDVGEAAGDVKRSTATAAVAGSMGPLWAAPRISDEYLIRHDCEVPPVFTGEGEARMLFLPGPASSLWDISGPARLMWRVGMPFRPSGALWSGRHLIVWDDWRLAALDRDSGNTQWTWETPRTGPVEMAGAAPIRDVRAAGRCVAFLKGAEVFVLESASGELINRYGVASQAPLRMAAGRGFFAVLATDRRTGTRCAIIDAETGAARTLVLVKAKFAPGARLVADGERVFICSPNDPFAAAVNAASGRKAWVREGLLRLVRIFEAHLVAGKLVISGIDEGVRMRTQVLETAGGALLGSYKGLAFAPRPDGTGIALGEDMSLSKHRLGAEAAVVCGGSGLGISWLPPAAWHFGAGGFQMLVEEAPKRARGALAVAAYDDACQSEGLWRLPLAAPPGWRPILEDVGGGRLVAAAGDGVAVFRVPGEGDTAIIPVYCENGRPDGTAAISARARRVDAIHMPALVVDGDLAEWRAAKWLDVDGADGRANVAFGWNDKGLGVAVRIAGEAAAAGGARLMRLAAGPAGERMGAVEFDITLSSVPRMLSIRQPADTEGLSSMQRPNRSGGTDYELLIPWRALGARGGVSNVAVGIACAEPDGTWWAWPRRQSVARRDFGVVAPAGREAEDADL